MNIWFFSAYDQPKGFSARTYDFARALISRGHQVTMFTNSFCHWTRTETLSPKEKWRIEQIDGIRVIWLKTIPYQSNTIGRGINMLSNAFRIIQVSKKLTDKPDVVLGPSVPPFTGFVASYIAKVKQAAFVFEVREVWPIRLVYDGVLSKKSMVYAVFRQLEKYLYRNAHRISSVFPLLRGHVADSGGMPEKVSWIPNGVDFRRFSGMSHYDGGNTSSLVVMYVGGFSDVQDIETIIKAAYLMQQKGNMGFQFVIVGNGAKKKEYMTLVNKLALENVVFHDAVPKSEVPRVQAGADVLVAAIFDSPGYQFGINMNKIYDYFSSSRPIIFSGNVPNDQVSEARAGFSIPPEDPEAMVRALENLQQMTAEERVAMGKRGREYVERTFDIHILAAQMEKLFLDAIKYKKELIHVRA